MKIDKQKMKLLIIGKIQSLLSNDDTSLNIAESVWEQMFNGPEFISDDDDMKATEIFNVICSAVTKKIIERLDELKSKCELKGEWI